MTAAAEIAQRTEGLTIPKAFLSTLAARRDEVAIRWKEGDEWAEWTWAEYANEVARAAGAFRSLGLTRGDRAVLMMRNIPTFHVLDSALSFLGVCSISIYNSSASDQIQYLVNHSEAKVAVVEDDGFLERFQGIRDELPLLESVVTLGSSDDDRVLSWGKVAEGSVPADLDELVDTAQPSDLATMIYTSGTTGPPKGVMLDHANIAWTGESLLMLMGEPTGWRHISYLPMAHIAERMTGHYNHIRIGSVVHTCPEPSKIAAYAAEVRPNLLFGVPRIWEKIESGVRTFVAGQPAEVREQMEQGLAVARAYAEAKVAGAPIPAELAEAHAAVDAALLGPARQLVGLDAIETAITGAAPISTETLWFFRSLGIKFSEIYGMSESTGPITWDPYEVRVGSVGRACPGVEVELADDGEVIFRGGNVFRGYLKDQAKTAETIDEQGWVHTGDIGRFDDDGYLFIVDRKKELIITAGGKNISPANIESKLKGSPLIGQACVIGDRRPYLVALVTLDPDVAPVWAASRGLTDTSMAALSVHPEVLAELDKWVAEVNEEFSRTEGVKKIRVLAEEWQPDSVELTPTMKLKRRGINERYAEVIEELYA